MDQQVRLTDVTLRDGLQMESTLYSAEQKLSLFRALVKCGFERLEVTSFVHPKWVPQFQDSEAFLNKLSSEKHPGVELMAFVPNRKGLERLLCFSIPWASAFVAATESFNQKNVNSSIDETLIQLKEVVTLAKTQGRKCRIYLSTAFGCPYEGAVKPNQTLEVVKKIAALQPDELALSDTIGVATPELIQEVVEGAKSNIEANKLVLHLHDTYGMALANAEAGYQAGVRSFDGSLGGIGGCPYAKGATGNVASESLMYLFYRQQRRNFFPLAEIENTLSVLKKDFGLQPQSAIHNILVKGGQVKLEMYFGGENGKNK